MAAAGKLLLRHLCTGGRLISQGYYHTHNLTNRLSVLAIKSQVTSTQINAMSTMNITVPCKQLDCPPNACGDYKFTSKIENFESLYLFNGLPKALHADKKTDDKPEKGHKRKVPKLILIQNPFKWLMIKFDFTVLRNIWDPTFKEKDFKFGTRQAISRITHVISSGNYAELSGLLTKPARLSLMRELERNWGGKQRTLLALNHDDIQITSPRKVYFIRIADKKFCDVDMAFLALKWAPINSIEALLFTEIFARFHREYTPHSIPEWTIAYFKVDVVAN